MSAKLHGRNIIAGVVKASGSDTTNALNPVSGAAMDPPFTHATVGEVEEAVQQAEGAQPELLQMDAAARASLLRRIGDEIMALGEVLIERCRLETALPEGRLIGERARTVNQLKLFADVVEEGSWVDARIDTPLPGRTPAPRPDLRRMLIPVGPVAVFCASNFPLAFSVAGGDTASALAAGCPVIVKAHSSHPGTAELVATAVQKAVAASGAPPGVFSLLHGPGSSVGIRLVTHPLIKAVGFTGSRKAGRALFDAAVSRPDPIPVYAEMGSINPVFLLPRALRVRKEEIAKGLTASATLGVGQFCTNPGLVIGFASEELEDLVAQTGRLFEQVPAQTMLNSRIAEAYRRGLERLENAPGVQIGGRSSAVPDPEHNQAQPTLFSAEGKAFLSDAGLSEEVFGPSTLVIQACDREELLKVAAALEGHLTATIHGTEEDLLEYRDLMAVLQRKVGRLIVNGFPTGVEVCRSMNHGGPWPATTDAHFTSVGTAAIYRFARPVCYQDVPPRLLPQELQDANPLGILRQVDGVYTRDALSR